MAQLKLAIDGQDSCLEYHHEDKIFSVKQDMSFHFFTSQSPCMSAITVIILLYILL